MIANVGDDLDWMGLRVCPDLDSILYALAGLWDGERGWGRRGETFRVQLALGRFARDNWFGIGDADLSLHLARTTRLRAGATLGAAMARVGRRLGVRGVNVIPASDERCETRIRLADGRVVAFQEWYVRDRAEPRVRETLHARGRPAGAALLALRRAAAVIFAPSNPVSSIEPILALAGMRAAVGSVPVRIAVSPVVCRTASADESVHHHARARRRLLGAQGRRDTPTDIARGYAGLVGRFLLDRVDASEAPAIRRAGIQPVLADLLDGEALAEQVLAATG